MNQFYNELTLQKNLELNLTIFYHLYTIYLLWLIFPPFPEDLED